MDAARNGYRSTTRRASCPYSPTYLPPNLSPLSTVSAIFCCPSLVPRRRNPAISQARGVQQCRDDDDITVASLYGIWTVGSQSETPRIGRFRCLTFGVTVAGMRVPPRPSRSRPPGGITWGSRPETSRTKRVRITGTGCHQNSLYSPSKVISSIQASKFCTVTFTVGPCPPAPEILASRDWPNKITAAIGHCCRPPPLPPPQPRPPPRYIPPSPFLCAIIASVLIGTQQRPSSRHF